MRISENIADKQFQGNASVDYVIIEDCVTRIGKMAFAKCPNLVSIRVEESDKPIKICLDYVKGCKNLVEVLFNRPVEFYKY